jgi:protein SCO1/2
MARTAGRSAARPIVASATWRPVLAVVVWLALAALPTLAEVGSPPLGGPAPNFALTTQQNDRLWLTHLRGRAVVLAFGCAACGACPDLLPRLEEVARGLGDAPGRRVFFLMVTVDPVRDTQAALREFGRARGLRAPAWLLLTEDRPGQTEAVARRYGVALSRVGEGVAADCPVTLIDGDGRIRARHDVGSLSTLDRELRVVLGLPAPP